MRFDDRDVLVDAGDIRFDDIMDGAVISVAELLVAKLTMTMDVIAGTSATG